MAGAALEINLREFGLLQRALFALSRTRLPAMLDAIGQEVTSQTQRRITDEKRAPDGTQWAGWSRGYATTRHGNQSLLESSGHLVQSITHNVLTSGNAVQVGSNLRYSALHQHGGSVRVTPKSRRFFWRQFFATGNAYWKALALTKRDKFDVPARPYLGLSRDDADDVLAVVRDFMRIRMRKEGLA